jgi:hypothetical protein
VVRKEAERGGPIAREKCQDPGFQWNLASTELDNPNLDSIRWIASGTEVLIQVQQQGASIHSLEDGDEKD